MNKTLYDNINRYTITTSILYHNAVFLVIILNIYYFTNSITKLESNVYFIQLLHINFV